MECADGIEQAAKQGNVSAMTALGKRKLAEASAAGLPTFEESVGLLHAAGEKGCGEADCLNAVVSRIFAPAQQDWSPALAYLQRSAERGWPAAREQLCFLSADRELAEAARSGRCDNTVWEKLRNTIDIPVLLASPPATVVSRAPRVMVIRGFANRAECEWMVERSRERIRPSLSWDLQTGAMTVEPCRTNGVTYFDFVDADLVIMLLRARIALATGLANPRLELTNVLHYAVGQTFISHVDWFDPAKAAGAAEIRANGQRIGTFLIYLNDDFEGAETAFPRVGWAYKGATGDALFFMNVDEAGNGDPLTQHIGLPPVSGEKWLLSQWIRGTPGVGL